MSSEHLPHSHILSFRRRCDFRGYEVHAIFGDADIRSKTLIDLMKVINDLREERDMKYYDLLKDQRWMPDNWSPEGIGGHPTDISQIALCLIRHVKGMFPINQVPQPLAQKLCALETLCESCEQGISEAIQLITDYKMKEVSNGRSKDESTNP